MEMTRRELLVAGAVSAVSATGVKMSNKAKFNLKYAPHFGMFADSAGGDSVDQIKFAADEGFHAWEDNGMRGRAVDEQNRIAQAFEQHGFTMGVFVANTIDWSNPTLTTGEKKHLDQFLSDCRASVEVAKRVGAKWMTVVPGTCALNMEIGYQTANVTEALRQACDIFEPHGLVMVLEPLNFRDHPNLFLNKISQAFSICRAVDSPSCKILDDLYHQQIHEGNLIPNINAAWSEIAYFQVGDNPGRNEPLTGEVNFRNVFGHIAGKGFSGVFGMEHGVSQSGKAGERRLIDAYRWCDSFAVPIVN